VSGGEGLFDKQTTDCTRSLLHRVVPVLAACWLATERERAARIIMFARRRHKGRASSGPSVAAVAALTKTSALPGNMGMTKLSKKRGMTK
jgi:hypothetical protein